MFKSLFSFIWLIIFTFCGTAAQIINYSSEHGITQNSIYALFRDSRGYLWIGNGENLQRFDGYQFKTYDGVLPDGNLARMFRGNMVEDKQGNIYIGCQWGMFKYDRKKDQLININDSFKIDKTIYLPVLHTIDKHGNIWGFTAYSIFKKESNHCRIYPLQPFLRKGEYLNQILQINHKTFVAGTSEGIRIFEINEEIKQIYFNPLKEIHALVSNPLKNEIIAGGTSLYTINIRNFQATLLDINMQENPVRALWIHQDKLYIGTENKGLWEYSISLNKVIHHFDKFSSGVAIKKIQFLYKDSQDLLWAGTDGNGLIKINLKEGIKLYKNGYPSGLKMENTFVKSVFKPNNEALWIGTLNDGLYQINQSNNEINKIYLDKHHERQTVNCILPFGNQQYFIGTDKGAGVYKENGQLLYAIAFNDAQNVGVNAVTKASDNKYYLATNNGIYYLEEGSKRAISYLYPTGRFLFISELDRGMIWFGGYMSTLYRLNLNKQSNIPLQKVDRISLIRNFIRHVIKANNKYYACSDNGLIEIDKELNPIKYFGKKEGLISPYLYAALFDGKEHIWISSNSGIAAFNLKKQTFTYYDQFDNIQNLEFNTGAFYQYQNKMFFGGIEGVNEIIPSVLLNRTYKPSIQFTHLKLNDSNIYLNGRKTIGAGINRLEIGFFLNDFVAPNKTLYYYKIKDKDTAWQSLGNNHIIYLQNLAPGNYAISIKAANHRGEFYYLMNGFEFTINKKFYQTWTFIITIVAIILLLLYVGIRWYYQQELKTRIAEENYRIQALEIKQEISRDLHDHLGSGLSQLNLMTTNLLQVDEGKDWKHSAEKIKDISKELNAQLKDIVWQVDIQHDNLQSLLSYLRLQISGWSDDTHIETHIEFEIPKKEILINPKIRQNLYLLTKESWNNMVKYSKATHVYFTFSCKENGEFSYQISDNGVGFKIEEISNFSNGIKNMRERMKQCKFEFNIESHIGKGTKIDIHGHFQLPH